MGIDALSTIGTVVAAVLLSSPTAIARLLVVARARDTLGTASAGSPVSSTESQETVEPSDAAASTATAEAHLLPPRREPAVSSPGRRSRSRSLLARTARHHWERTARGPPFLFTMA